MDADAEAVITLREEALAVLSASRVATSSSPSALGAAIVAISAAAVPLVHYGLSVLVLPLPLMTAILFALQLHSLADGVALESYRHELEDELNALLGRDTVHWARIAARARRGRYNLSIQVTVLALALIVLALLGLAFDASLKYDNLVLALVSLSGLFAIVLLIFSPLELMRASAITNDNFSSWTSLGPVRRLFRFRLNKAHTA